MLFINRSFISCASVMVFMGFLSPSLFAENKNFFFNNEKPQLDESTDSGLDQTLEYNFSPDDRARLRKALADYAKNSDPEHTQIELKRKAMQLSVQDRFYDCNEDNDDSIDRIEATNCMPQVARHFNFVDFDEDGVITLDELELAQAKSVERQKRAEAKLETQRVQEAETAIKEKNKSKLNKQAINIRKRPI